ncbi:MAG TPA: GNAT family N-acetyltransferase, partial [Acidimicrobiia bacterium]|nr:GNAT family N-acetyltransferase [Acidimicrobiia bacterium]
WQEAYRGGLMPDEYLDSLSIDDRAEMWQRFLASDPRPQHRRFVADDLAGSAVGFILVGPGGDGPALEGEVYALNVDPDHWGGGAGTMLLDAGTRALIEEGFTTAVLWVHPGNGRARRFYEARGWSADDAERTQEVLGVTVPEARYVRPLR